MGETTNIIYDVQNFEEEAIADARVPISIESPGYELFLSIQNQTSELNLLAAKDAATGEIRVPITAIGSPSQGGSLCGERDIACRWCSIRC